MSHEEVDVMVVGAGQAGLAMSEHLTANGLDHVVFERSRIAERWRSERWDSLVSIGPAWHDHFPGREFTGVEPGAFVPKEQIVDYFVDYAEQIAAPVRCGVEVVSVRRHDGGTGFRAETSDGTVDARYVVAATGRLQRPRIPAIVPRNTDVLQLHSSGYRNPQQLPGGAILVVGSGSSGVQIADELHASGREVYFSISRHTRPPRRYRDRDIVWWFGVLGVWDAHVPSAPGEESALAATGMNGGSTIDFRRLAERGIRLVGRSVSFDDGTMHFAPDLSENLAYGEASYLSLLDQADAYVSRYGLDLPDDPGARLMGPRGRDEDHPILELDLAESSITSIIWATGFASDYSWLHVDAFGADGQPDHHRGVSVEPGVYFLGLPWLSRRKSSFISGVWHDARYITDQIVTHRDYVDHLETHAPRP